ncbi:hypothetical protein DERF_010991 [Dermatophagoides farinae]|uniref:Uncharacterized protein n=1 Tax=Dermatophagoides farinae TaxID=6954 RepID=A0A922HU28_DERFA|nr:hypothetical protein DERF_010991 [Dermatophagoides farinae]
MVDHWSQLTLLVFHFIVVVISGVVGTEKFISNVMIRWSLISRLSTTFQLCTDDDNDDDVVVKSICDVRWRLRRNVLKVGVDNC